MSSGKRVTLDNQTIAKLAIAIAAAGGCQAGSEDDTMKSLLRILDGIDKADALREQKIQKMMDKLPEDQKIALANYCKQLADESPPESGVN